QLSAGSSRAAAWQRAERLHVHRFRPFRDQICVQEILMAHLVVGDVMDVLREVTIDAPESFRVDSIVAPSGNLAVLDSAQFVVLGVKVGLESFSGSQEPQDRSIAGGEGRTVGAALGLRE